MLTLIIDGGDVWNEELEEFQSLPCSELHLEHSLLSISKWESETKKPFLSSNDKTVDEIEFYIKCMTLNKNVDDSVYNRLTQSHINKVVEYIEHPMTATTFSKTRDKPNREIITSEILYYDMIALNIPFECQKWHLNRLLTLIRVCSIKSQPSKKMSKKEIFDRNRALNAARKKKLNTNG